MKYSHLLAAVALCGILLLALVFLDGFSKPAVLIPATIKEESQPAFKKAPIVIIFTHGSAETSSTHAMALKFKELVEKRSNGELFVDIFPNYTLGNADESGEAVKNGTIHIRCGSFNSNLIPALEIFSMPHLIPDRSAAVKMLSNNTLRSFIDKEFEKMGLKLLGAAPDSLRVISSNKLIKNIEDFKGIKIRSGKDELYTDYWRILGAQPMSLEFRELYVALMQNAVDAQENPIGTIMASKLYEQQKYIILTNHVMHFNALYMNKAFLDKLPGQYQAIIHNVVPEVLEYAGQYSVKVEQEAHRMLKEAGLEIIELTPETTTAMKLKAAPVMEMVRKKSGNGIMDMILDALGGVI